MVYCFMAGERTGLLGCFGALPPGKVNGFPTVPSRWNYNSLGEELRHTDGCSYVMLSFTLVTNKADVLGQQSTNGAGSSIC